MKKGQPEFLTRLVTTPLEDGKRWMLTEDFQYWSPLMPAGHELIVVPSGFVCDLASIPQIAHSVMPKHGRHTWAAVVHDWLYHCRFPDRKTADRIFLEAMTVMRVEAWRKWVMYLAVRLAGQRAWAT